MATRTKNGLSKAEAMQLLRSSMQPPAFALVVSVDGVPTFLALLGDEADAAQAATNAGMKAVFQNIAREDGGHHVRCTVHTVQDEPVAGLPAFYRSLNEGVQTWELNVAAKPKTVGNLGGTRSSASKKTSTATKPNRGKAAAKQPTKR